MTDCQYTNVTECSTLNKTGISMCFKMFKPSSIIAYSRIYYAITVQSTSDSRIKKPALGKKSVTKKV